MRTTYAQGSKSNKWVSPAYSPWTLLTSADTGNKFSLETEEFEEFQTELRIWRTSTNFGRQSFPSMIIETYLDLQVPAGQCLMVVNDNDNGRKWDVLEALNSPINSSGESTAARSRNTEVILERWRFELDPVPIDQFEEFGYALPTSYKKAVPLFRSLHAFARLIPAHTAHRVYLQSLEERRSTALEVKCRILTTETESTGIDTLRHPITNAPEAVVSFAFGDLEVPTGCLSASVVYRTDHFKLVDSEPLLNSRFTAMEIDENFFKPSLPQRISHTRRETSAEIGSLPSRRRGREPVSEDVTQAYGSLSTFHGVGAMGTSPISALRALKPMGSESSSPRGAGSPRGSMPASIEEPAHSLPIRTSSFRGYEGLVRRTSVSTQPFKSGSLSNSPRIPEGSVSASPMSGQRQSGLSALAQARKRNSLTAGMPATLRGGPPPGELPMSSSPRPSSSRVSSSFSHRRARSSFGGQSRGEDDQMSSGRQSLTSSQVQPGSGILAEGGSHSNSGSLNNDGENISEFLKALDNGRTLRSFEPKNDESAMKRTGAQLSKFQQMRESNNALTESMLSSMHLHRSSITSSRQLASVPGMVAPASMSVSSSPGGKPLSPITPHTPIVPSRLSENSIIDYESQASAAHRATRLAPQVSLTEEELESHPAVNPEGTAAIDIPLPLSPRLTQVNRRSSSVAQQQRNMVDDDDNDGFGSRRSISLGAEREPPTLSTLFTMEGGSGEDSAGLQPAAHIRSLGVADSTSSTERERATPGSLLTSTTADTPGRVRYTSRLKRPTPTHSSSRGSFASSSRGGFGTGRGDNEADDEPLLFDMQVSEVGRRSLEEGRGGGSVGSSQGIERNNEDKPRGISQRGWR